MRMKEKKVWTIAVGTHNKSSKEAVELASTEDGVFATIGIHPTDKIGEGMNEALFEDLIQNPKVVGIGECGLDYYRAKDGSEEEKKRQKDLFEKQIHFALEHDKPLMIHSRNAYPDTLEILKSFSDNSKLRGNIHFFAGNLVEAKQFLDLGFTMSFTGVITFTNDYDETVRFVPLDSILSETDAPFVTPDPFRGKKNEPSYVDLVVQKIAFLRDEPLEIVKEAMVENTLRVFGF